MDAHVLPPSTVLRFPPRMRVVPSASALDALLVALALGLLLLLAGCPAAAWI